MTLVNVDRRQGCSSKSFYGCKEFDFDLKLRNGKDFVVTIKDNMQNLRGEKINPLTGEIADLDFRWHNKTSKYVTKVIFSDDVGEVRINPQTGSIWPSYYNFDPKTGETLNWKKAD